MLSESVDRLPGKCLTFYARVKVQVKKKYACEQIIFYEGNKIILVEIKELSTVSYINIRTKKYYDFAKGKFV